MIARRAAALLVLGALAPRAAAEVSLEPPEVAQGSFAVLRLPRARGTGRVAAFGRTLPLHRGRAGLYALVPVPLKARPGRRTLVVTRGSRRTKAYLGVAARDVPAVRTLSRVVVTERVAASIRDNRGEFLRAIGRVTAEARWTGAVRAPVDGPVSSGFGIPRRYGGGAMWTHKGVDFASPRGSPVVATMSGRVVLSRRMGSYGNTVVIDHGRSVFTAYLHLAARAVPAGRDVEAGEVVGTVGATGMASGPHLHFGAYIDRMPVDPLDLLARGLPL